MSVLFWFLLEVNKYCMNTALNTRLCGFPLASQSVTVASLLSLMSTNWISETVMECGLDYLKVSFSLRLINNRHNIQIFVVR